jgi:hypothetical protein
MSSWGKNDNAANAPYWAVSSVVTTNAPTVSAPTAANVALLYGNTQFQAYTTNETVGLFLVDAAETISGGDKVVDISLSNQGSGYVEAPSVSFSGGGGTSAAATASIAGGKISNITVTNVGSGYTSDPTVVLQVPVMTVAASAVNLTSDTINYASHGQANSAALVYNNGGGTSITGLTSGTTYYVSNPLTNSFTLSTSAANAANNVVINLTGQGNNAQYFTIVAGVRATAVADRGLSQGQSGAEHATHIGWNLKTVGSGGRAGRVQFETLVALANPIGDGSDDITLPDA